MVMGGIGMLQVLGKKAGYIYIYIQKIYAYINIYTVYILSTSHKAQNSSHHLVRDPFNNPLFATAPLGGECIQLAGT